MAITLKDRFDIAAQMGLQPHEIDITEDRDGSVRVVPARKPATDSTALGTFGRYAVGNAPGAAVGTTTGVAAMETAAPLVNTAAEALRGIPRVGAIAAPVAKFVGNALTFGAGATGGKYLAEEHMGVGNIKDLVIGDEKQQALDVARHPWMMRGGEFAANFAGQKIPDFRSLGSGLAKVGTLRRLSTADFGLAPKEAAALANAGGSAVMGAGQEALGEWQAGEELSPGKIAAAGLAGGIMFGDPYAPFQKAGAGIAAGLKNMVPGARARRLVNAPKQSESDILAQFKAPETTTAEPAATEAVDPLAAEMAKGRRASVKATTADQVANARQAMKADKILSMDRGEYVRKKLEIEIKRQAAEGKLPPEDMGQALNELARLPAEELAQFHDDFQSQGRTALNEQRVKGMLAGPASEAQVQENIKRTLEPQGPPAPEPRLTTADVTPEAPLTGPSTRDIVQRFLPGKPTGYYTEGQAPSAGKPRQVDYTFGQGPEDPVTLEAERIQNELEGRRVRYQEEKEAEANAVGRAVEGAALASNPMLLPAALLRGKGETTADPTGWQAQKTRMRAQGTPEIPGASALERRGFGYTPTAEPIMTPEGRRARGSFTPQTGEIAIDPTVANATTAKHEGMHAELQDMLLSGNPKLEALATEMIAIAGEEPLAEGGAVASNAQEKLGRLTRLIKDNWNYFRTTRLGLSDKSPERLARVLAERFDFQAPGPVKTGAAGAIKPQPMTDDRDFVTQTEKFLREGAPGLQRSKSGAVDSMALATWARKLPQAEQDLLEQAGFFQKLAGGHQTPEAFADWLRDNGPQLRMESYGMRGKVSAERQEYDDLAHWRDGLQYEKRLAIDTAFDHRFNRSEGRDTYLEMRGFTPAEIVKAARYSELLQKGVNSMSDNGPVATSAYRHVSALPTQKPMPEWTVSKLGDNVQRVDVVLPPSKVKGAEVVGPNGEILATYEGPQAMELAQRWKEYNARKSGTVRESSVDKFDDVKWHQDNLHENLPNTLGWAMIQYTTGPRGEKIAHIAESQSRWGQTVRNAKQNPDESTGFERTTKDHPLLSDYNRLILKAAIDQARKEGATHIHIADAETAMMTEGHDVAAQQPLYKPEEVGKFGVFQPNARHAGKAFNTLAEAQALADRQNEWYRTELGRPDAMTARQITEADTVPVIEQAGGMRFNYDNQLPKIASELLGPGQRVSLGEHKNALTDALLSENPTAEEIRAMNRRLADNPNGLPKKRPRPNLIFRNPDGTPKTDISGMLFPIDKVAGRRAAGEPFTMTGKRFQEMTSADDFQGAVPKAVLNVDDPVVTKAGYDFMADKARISGATFNTAIADAKALGGEQMWRQVMEKRSRAFDTGTAPAYTPEEQPMADRIQQLYDEYYVLRNNFGLPGNNAPNYTGHLADIGVIRKAEKDYDTFAAEFLPRYLQYNQNEYGPAQVGGFDPVEAAQTFRDYFTGAARAPHSEFGADFGVLTKSARQYGLPPEMRAPYDFRHAMRFGERFVRGLMEHKHLKSNPHVAKKLGLDEGGSPAGEQYRLFRAALAGQLPNIGKTSSIGEAGELYDAARQTVNTAIMQAPTGLWNTLSKIKDYGVVIAQNPEIGFKALVDASGDVLGDFSNLRREAIAVDAIRPGQDYIGANENLGVGSNIARNMRNFNTKARMVSGTEAIEQFNRVQDYAFGKRLAEAALALRRANDPAAADFWNRFGAGIDDKMPDAEIIKRAAGNFVRDIQGSYGPEGLPAWLLTSGKRSLAMRLNRFGWENMRRVQRNVIEPARNGNWMPLLVYIGLAGVTAEVRKELADKLLKQPSGLPTAQEIEAAGAEPAIEQTLNLMEMADAAGAFGFAGGTAGALAKNLRGTKRAVVMDPTISFGWQLTQNLAAAVDAMREGEPAGPVVQEVLKRTLVDSIQNLRPLAADRGEAQDKRNKKVFSDLTDRKKVTSGAVLEGLLLGSLTQPGRKISPTTEAAKAGDREAYMKLTPEERRRADNYPGGYEDTTAERDYRKFIETAQGTESLEDYLARRQEYRRRVRQP